MPQQNQNNNLYWYKDAIIYELHIKAFRDSNNDGIGDIPGLLEKLDYLKDLGVTAIWVLPFYPSPLRDDGYDIADYYRINPAYGDINQFKKLLNEAHKRDLKVITELVINHTSDQHPWFQKARHAPKDSPLRNYYVWSDDPNKYKDVRIIFQDFETSNWTWDPVAQQYYWHRFFYHQPDLNYDNPQVQNEVFKILDYWCELGVDGFRLDAVPYLFEREFTNGENLPETHQFLKKLRKHVDTKYPGTLLLAEANMWPEDSASYFGKGDECHMNYHFPVMPRMFMALQSEDRYPITDIFDQTPDIPESCQWAIFLRNHDELTLEMVTDEERDYMYKVYVKDPKARINLGIRHRLAPLMGNDRKKIELLNFLLFSLPGTPVIYYGDEIGMGDNFYLGDRDGVRTPMQWSADRNAGFSESNPHRLYLPVILDPEYHYGAVNVERQLSNTSSLLWWMKRLIDLRKKHKALSWGDIKFINAENSKVLAFTRTYKAETMLIVVNLSRYSQVAELDLDIYRGHRLVELFSKNSFPTVKAEAPYLFTLGAYDCQWFLIKKVHMESKGKENRPVLIIDSWRDLTKAGILSELENYILPDYLQKVRWFGGKSRTIQHIKIVGTAAFALSEKHAYLLIIEVVYQSGLPEKYQLPITFAKKSEAEKIRESCPQSVITEIEAGSESGILYDALFSAEYLQDLISRMGNNKHLHQKNAELRFTGNKALKQFVSTHDKIKSKVLGAEQSNTSINFANTYFLKIYRKVEQSVNPDVEITRFLTEKAKFEHIPAYIGAIEWKFENGETMVLGMMQQMIESSSDAWGYMLDRLNVYNEKILSREKKNLPSLQLKGSLLKPLVYNQVPEDMKELLDARVAEQVRLLGVRTGQMHLALASEPNMADFKPENFSLHYQRSLFSSFQSLVNRAFQSQSNNIDQLSPEVRKEAEEVLDMKDDILGVLKQIYRKKINAVKIRIHGDYHLGQALYTGKDFVILDFEGEPARPYSERRLKRSPLRDVAGIVRSFHYAAYGGLFLSTQTRKQDINRLIPYAEQWYHYMSGFFVQAYLETVQHGGILPEDKEDLEVLMQTYILEKAIYELNYELNNRPDWVMIPLRGIKAIMKKAAENKKQAE